MEIENEGKTYNNGIDWRQYKLVAYEHGEEIKIKTKWNILRKIWISMIDERSFSWFSCMIFDSHNCIIHICKFSMT